MCEIYTIEIEAYWWNKSISDREEMEMVEKTQGIKDMEGESAAILWIQTESDRADDMSDLSSTSLD